MYSKYVTECNGVVAVVKAVHPPWTKRLKLNRSMRAATRRESKLFSVKKKEKRKTVHTQHKPTGWIRCASKVIWKIRDAAIGILFRVTSSILQKNGQCSLHSRGFSSGGLKLNFAIICSFRSYVVRFKGLYEVETSTLIVQTFARCYYLNFFKLVF